VNSVNKASNIIQGLRVWVVEISEADSVEHIDTQNHCEHGSCICACRLLYVLITFIALPYLERVR